MNKKNALIIFLFCTTIIATLAWGMTFRYYYDKTKPDITEQKLPEQARLFDDEWAEWQAVVANRDNIIEWYKNKQPEIITEYIEVPVEVIKEVEIPVDVKSIVEVPQVMREFESTSELKGWLASFELTLIIVSGEPFNGQCENFSFQLRDRAKQDGYLVETEILTPAEYLKYYNKPFTGNSNDGHYICKTVIGNQVFFIEPQDDTVWLAYYLD